MNGTTWWVRSLALGVFAAAAVAQAGERTVQLADLDLDRVTQGWGRAAKDRSVTGKALSIAGQAFARGVGTHARGSIWLALHGDALRLTAVVGVDDAATDPARASVDFTVLADGAERFRSGTMRRGEPARAIDVDLRGVRFLLLRTGDAGDGVDSDHADWALAAITFAGRAPELVAGPDEPARILTPPPPPEPRLHGPAVLGCRPGHPFLHRIPATGDRPMTFAADGLPVTLRLDAATGILRGTVPPAGTYPVVLHATNGRGTASRTVRIVAGDRIALTPPMGWNHWYAHYGRITGDHVKRAAEVLLASGLADVGYEYVNLDDGWANAPQHADSRRTGPLRDAHGDLLANSYFPDLAELTAYLHDRGLKAGIYTSPGPLTCAGFAGSYGHEAADAKWFANQGFDFVKYDWCSYDGVVHGARDLATLQAPYRKMGELLRAQDRDIVFNLCQYGMGDVAAWGEAVGGHCWRTADDLGFSLDRIQEVAIANAAHAAHSRPGAFNDPDYLQIGFVGDAASNGLPRPCGLTPNEQYSFMSAWCLSAAPLIYSGDLEQLDPFTVGVLGNPEVIAVDQDELCRGGRVVELGGEAFAMVKELVDGAWAVGVFQRGEFPADVDVRWAAMGLPGKCVVRDLWRQVDVGVVEGGQKVAVGRHGVVMWRVAKAG